MQQLYTNLHQGMPKKSITILQILKTSFHNKKVHRLNT